MFWKILHILRLRPTSDPPQLSPKSPLRVYFHKHGETVARHPIRTILGSLLVVILACYPLPFIWSSSSSLALPSHVWTTSRPFSSYSHDPDVEIKQAWVQGSYMGALEKNILEEALFIQETLLGQYASCSSPTSLSEAPKSTPTGLQEEVAHPLDDAFFHSPLMYWNCSLSNIQNDSNLIETVNLNSGQQTAMNLTLRWGSVLAGKAFLHNKLIEADALVITLFYKPGSPAGKLWDQRAAALSQQLNKGMLEKRLEMFPKTGRITKYSQYEFVFQHMNSFDIFVVVACYSLLLLYLGASLRKMSAIRSRFWLYVTFLAEVLAAVFSSFTILAILKIPVSHIPREFYPFVVMVIGLENMFRLMNAVFETPPEIPVQNRIATAVGNIGFLSTVAVATDLMFLFVVAQISLPAVQEICVFAGLAIFLDFLLHLTFFVAILRVEISRLELKDSLEKLNELKIHSSGDRRGSDDSIDRQPHFTDFLFNIANTPVSSRVAGTIIMVCFVIAMNYHFVENETPLEKLRQIVDFLQDVKSATTDTSPVLPMNQARTPTAWLRRQDQMTGMELIRAVKPGASRIVAQVFEPLYFVAAEANRSKTPPGSPRIESFIDIDFTSLPRHLKTLIYTAAVILAFVTLMLNYFLGFSIRDDESTHSDESMSPVTCKSLEAGHTLDVVLVAASKKGLLVSVGLDRRIVVWKLKGTNKRYTKEFITPTCAEHTLCPVIAIAVDDDGDWIAIAPKNGSISLWEVKESAFTKSLPIDFQGHRPPGFFFAPRANSPEWPRLLIVTQSGALCDLSYWKRTVREDGVLRDVSKWKITVVKDHMICSGDSIIAAQAVQAPKLPFKIVSTTASGNVYMSTYHAGTWISERKWSPNILPFTPTEPTVTVALPNVGLMLYGTSGMLSVVEFGSGQVLKSLQTGQFIHKTLRAFHGKRQSCPNCGFPSITSLSIAYTIADTGMFVMNTFATSSKHKSRRICLRPRSIRDEEQCLALEDISESTHWFERAGGWETTALNSVIGLHRCKSERKSNRSSRDYNLRRRQIHPTSIEGQENQNWEIWTMDFDGKVALYSLDEWAGTNRPFARAQRELLVTRPGPVTKIGPRTVGVGFGNNIKILSLGFERFHDDEDQDEISHGTTYIRKRPHRTALLNS